MNCCSARKLSNSIVRILILAACSALIACQFLLFHSRTAVETIEIKGFVYPSVIYGHVHIAKTAGTTVNGELAAHYERVCGHKGYSYDFHKANERFRKTRVAKNTQDTINKVWRSYSRIRVPMEAMQEIGFEDCDYVSLETNWTAWPELFQNNWTVPLELHVPCREPIDHLLSFTNHWKKTFECVDRDEELVNETFVQQQLDYSVRFMDRFSMNLLDNFTVKCFDFRNVSGYLAYMDNKLQKRRIKSDFVPRETNHPRDKSKECLWDHPELQSIAKAYLHEKYDYYDFCNRCIGSTNDLLVGDAFVGA